MYYVMRASAPSLHRESTDSLIHVLINKLYSNDGYSSLYVCMIALQMVLRPPTCMILTTSIITGAMSGGS